jgi:hypothetical protein
MEIQTILPTSLRMSFCEQRIVKLGLMVFSAHVAGSRIMRMELSRFSSSEPELSAEVTNCGLRS